MKLYKDLIKMHFRKINPNIRNDLGRLTYQFEWLHDKLNRIFILKIVSDEEIKIRQALGVQ